MASELLKYIDKYVVLENLGKGARSTIWKVQDPGTGTFYTLKRVIRERDEDDRFLEQMRIEFEVSSTIDHEYLRKSFEMKRIRSWFKTQELLLLLEYVDGLTLKQCPPTDVEQVIEVFTKVGRGLDVLHHAGYIHADIKPKNVLVPGNGIIKIIDFGQSCPIGHRKKRIQGTPDFMAPEQVKRSILDQRTDVFNLGASMYWVLTGQTFPSTVPRPDSPGEFMVAPVKEFPRPDQLNPNCPSALSKLVMDCCERKPSRRPDNMGEVLARLDVARHLLLRQKAPEKYGPKQKHVSGQSADERRRRRAVSPDDTAEFERFLEEIL